jgi:signal transduction histidine kinase
VAGAGVLVTAWRTRVARGRLASAARRLEGLTVAPASSWDRGVVLAPVDDGPGASLVDEILRDNLRAGAAIATRGLEVRESQARVVAAADRERLRIERDLHDGAQQRLVAATFCLALAEGKAAPHERAVLRYAVDELQTVLGAVRAVGEAAFPRLLDSDGLVAALEGLAASAPVPVRLVSPSRLVAVPRSAAMSAYACVRVLAVPEARRVEVVVERAVDERDALRLSIASALTVRHASSVVDRSVRDRVGAVGGTIRVTDGGEGSVVEVVVPCGS